MIDGPSRSLAQVQIGCNLHREDLTRSKEFGGIGRVCEDDSLVRITWEIRVCVTPIRVPDTSLELVLIEGIRLLPSYVSSFKSHVTSGIVPRAWLRISLSRRKRQCTSRYVLVIAG